MSTSGRDWRWPTRWADFERFAAAHKTDFFLDVDAFSIMSPQAYEYFYSDLIRKDVFEYAGAISTLSLECQLARPINQGRGMAALQLPTHSLYCYLKWLGAVKSSKQRRVEVSVSLKAPFYATVKFDNAGKITARLDKEVPKTWLSAFVALEWAIQRVRELPLLQQTPFFVYALYTQTLSSRMPLSRAGSQTARSETSASPVRNVNPELVKYFYSAELQFTGAFARETSQPVFAGAVDPAQLARQATETRARAQLLDDALDADEYPSVLDQASYERQNAESGVASANHNMSRGTDAGVESAKRRLTEARQIKMTQMALAEQAQRVAKHFRSRNWREIVSGAPSASRAVSDFRVTQVGQSYEPVNLASGLAPATLGVLRYEHVPPSGHLPIPPGAAETDEALTQVPYRDDVYNFVPLQWLSDTTTALFFEPRMESKWCGPLYEMLCKDHAQSPVSGVTLAMLKQVSACDTHERELETEFRPILNRDPLAVNHRRMVYFDLHSTFMSCPNSYSLSVMAAGYKVLLNAARASMLQACVMRRVLLDLRKKVLLLVKKSPRIFRQSTFSKQIGGALLNQHLQLCFPEIAPDSTASPFQKECAMRVFQCLARALNECVTYADDKSARSSSILAGDAVLLDKGDVGATAANASAVDHVHLTSSDWQSANQRAIQRARNSNSAQHGTTPVEFDPLQQDVDSAVAIVSSVPQLAQQATLGRGPVSTSQGAPKRRKRGADGFDAFAESGASSTYSTLSFETKDIQGLGSDTAQQPTSCLLTLLLLHLPRREILESDSDPHFHAVVNSTSKAPSHCGCWQDYVQWK